MFASLHFEIHHTELVKLFSDKMEKQQKNPQKILIEH